MGKSLTVDFETHFYTPQVLDYICHRKDYPFYTVDPTNKNHRMSYAPGVSVNHGIQLIDKLLDLSETRIELMTQCGIDIQVLSLSEPSVEWLIDVDLAKQLAHEANDILAHATEKHPNHFRGFAALAPQDPTQAAKELERCVTKLNFIGWLTHSNFGQNNYLDDKKYWPILEAAEALNVPIYLHPLIPAMEPFYKYGFSLAGAPLGFQFETAMCLMRMILGGVFDEFPNLRIMLGHLGETLPFLMERLDFTFDKPWFSKEDRPQLKRKPSEVLRQNVYITVSGRFYEPALHYTIEAMGCSHVLFASDHPYETMQESVNFIKNAKLSDTEKSLIFSENAKIFLR